MPARGRRVVILKSALRLPLAAHRPGRPPDPPGGLRPRYDAPRPRGRYRERVSAGPPPLSVRLRRRAWVWLDWAVAAACALLVYGVLRQERGLYVFPLSLWLVGAWALPLLAAIVALPVGLRRRDPVGALLLALAGCSVMVAVGGDVNRGPFVPLALVLFTVAATRTRTVAIAALAACLALTAVQGLILSLSGRGASPAPAVALLLIIAWLVGVIAQQRRSYTARAREQVATAAVAQERLRIARELHDVVAHSMTVVAVQAGFGEYVFDTDPGEARAALGAIQRVTREALTDMQRLLGVLRQDGTGEPAPPARPLALAPAPGLADLERLVATTAGAGVCVTVTRTGEPRDIPAGIDQSAFRIVQEGLTNVVKHSGASSCRVEVGYERAGLCVQVTDPGSAGPGAAVAPGDRPAGAGHGILGMRERVSLCGGEFTAGPLPGRGFRVAARFPLPAPALPGQAR